MLKKIFALIPIVITQFFYFYETYLRILPSNIHLELIEKYNISETGYSFLFASYYYAYILMQIPAGILFDRYSSKKVILLSISTVILSVLYFNYATNYQELVLSRFILGLGSSFAYIGVMKLAILLLPSRYISLIAGLTTTIGMLAGVIVNYSVEPILINYGLMNLLNTVFYVGLFIILLLILLIPPINVDVPKDSMISLQSFYRIVLDQRIWGIGFVGTCLYIPISVIAESWGIPYCLSLGMSKIDAKSFMNSIFMGFASGAIFFGILPTIFKIKDEVILLLSSVCTFLLFIVILYSAPKFIEGYFLMSLFSGSQIMVFSLVAKIVPKHAVATAVAVVNSIVSLSGAVILPFMGYLIKNYDYTVGFSLVTILLLLASFYMFKLVTYNR